MSHRVNVRLYISSHCIAGTGNTVCKQTDTAAVHLNPPPPCDTGGSLIRRHNDVQPRGRGGRELEVRRRTVPANPNRPGRPRDPNRDEAILNATMQILSRDGYSALRIENVAREAGVAKTTIYHRWL